MKVLSSRTACENATWEGHTVGFTGTEALVSLLEDSPICTLRRPPSPLSQRKECRDCWGFEEAMDVRRRVVRPGYEYGGEINIEDLQARPVAPPPKWRRAVENSLWLSAASFILYYGDSHSNFFSVLTSNPRIVRRPFYVGLLCVGINTFIFFYLAVWLRHIKKTSEDWEVIAPGAIPTATILGVAAFLMFVFALWPVWGFLTIPLVVTLFMAFVIISPYLPPYTKTNKEGSRAD